MVGALAGLLAPQRCAGCGSAPSLLCDACAARLPPPSPFGRVAHVARLVAPWAYEGAARSLVLALKLEGLRAAARPLVAGMAGAAAASGLAGSVVVWVPGRIADKRRRGYDHAEVLAVGFGRAVGLPAVPLLWRAREPPDQAALSAAARRRNLVDAFWARPCSSGVVLVDDVVTTGTTAAACAAALRTAGAPSVEVVVPCRA